MHIPFRRARSAIKPIRNKDLVLLVIVAGGKNIGSLQGLRKVSENVEHSDDAFGRILWASDVWTSKSPTKSGLSMTHDALSLTILHSAERLIRSLWHVSRGYHRRDITAGLAVAITCRHSGHGGGLTE